MVWSLSQRNHQNHHWWQIITKSWVWCSPSLEITCSMLALCTACSTYQESKGRTSHKMNFKSEYWLFTWANFLLHCCLFDIPQYETVFAFSWFHFAHKLFLRMASRVLCATLAIPIPPSRNVIGNLLVLDESAVEKQRKLATLLMLQTPPTRQSLVKDLVSNIFLLCMFLCQIVIIVMIFFFLS